MIAALLAALVPLLALNVPTGATGHPPAAAWSTAGAARAQQPAFAIRVDEAAGFRPVIELGRTLADPALEDAARAGFPLRLRFRVELWRDGFFDNLAGSAAWSTVIAFEPLDGRFLVRTQASPAESRDFGSFAAARSAVEQGVGPDLRPDRSGRYYYTAVLEIETLSLTDLQELEQWLRGELQPAVSGGGSVPAAVGQGAKRLLIRMLGLPTRRFDSRTQTFRVP